MKRQVIGVAILVVILGAAGYVYMGNGYDPPIPIESRLDCERPVFADSYADCVREYWRLLEAGEIAPPQPVAVPTPAGLAEYQKQQAARARYEAWLDEDPTRRAAIEQRKASEAARARYQEWLAEQ